MLCPLGVATHAIHQIVLRCFPQSELVSQIIRTNANFCTTTNIRLFSIGSRFLIISTTYARAISAAAAAAALQLLLGVWAQCYTAAMRRLSIDATGARCAVCTWGVLCDVGVSTQNPQHDDYFFADRSRLQQKKVARRAPASATHPPEDKMLRSINSNKNVAVVDEAHGGVIDVASAPCQPSGP